jgi:putative transport protein
MNEAAMIGEGPVGVHLLTWLGGQSFILLFLVVAAGYALGRVKIKGVGLGTTASSLLIALGVSLWGAKLGAKIAVPPIASTIFFNLFMFSVGMKVGPQFLAGLKHDAGKFIFFGLAIPLLSAGLTLAMRALVHLEPGMLPGLLAGSTTASPGLGAAEAAYAAAGDAGRASMANLSTAFAFSYCISMIAFIVLMKLPDMLGRDTPGSARRLEAQIRGGSPLPGTADEFLGGPLPVARRAYQIESPRLVGHRLGELRRTYPMVAIERVLREGKLFDPADEVVLQPHDTLALYGRVPLLLRAAAAIGPEVDAPGLCDIGSETADVVAQNKIGIDRTLQDLVADIGHGLFLNAMFRGGHEIPHGPETVVRRGDVLRVTGAKWRIKSLEKTIGKVIRPSVSTDIVTLALGLALGSALGAVTIPLGALRVAVGSAVGLLLVGIVLSILRTRQPGLGGPFPEPARQLLEDLGLNIFIVVLGLNAGPGVAKAIAGGGLVEIIVGSLVIGIVPAVLCWLVGAFLFKMNDALLLGAIAGGRCNSAGMRVAQEASQSTVPAISYPVTFAISNVVLTVLSYVYALIG